MDKKVIVIGIIFSLFLMLIFTNLYWFVNQEDYSKDNYLLLTLMRADADVLEISVPNQKADSYYNEASYSYEDMNYPLVESNCRLARGYYLETSQGYKTIKAELKATEIKDKLVDIYVERLDLYSEIADNMYEACEHFESTARYYDKYFNTDVAYGDASYDMGTKELDMMNEKIREHDKNVGLYNDKLEEYRAELKSKIDVLLQGTKE